MSPVGDSESRDEVLPAVLRGREGRLNGHIIRFLAANGPSLIYAVAKYLSDTSQTRIHYPTVNRRTHDLLNQNYLQKAGTKSTKAGVQADLYATTLRGDFAAVAGLTRRSGKDHEAELSPSQVRQIIKTASMRRGSPFVLLQLLLEDSQAGKDLVEKVLAPEVVEGVRSGYLNLEANDDSIICSAFASLIARKVMSIVSPEFNPSLSAGQKECRQYAQILLGCIDKVTTDHREPPSQLAPVPMQWARELKVFLKLSAVRLDSAG